MEQLFVTNEEMKLSMLNSKGIFADMILRKGVFFKKVKAMSSTRTVISLVHKDIDFQVDDEPLALCISTYDFEENCEKLGVMSDFELFEYRYKHLLERGKIVVLKTLSDVLSTASEENYSDFYTKIESFTLKIEDMYGDLGIYISNDSIDFSFTPESRESEDTYTMWSLEIGTDVIDYKHKVLSVGYDQRMIRTLGDYHEEETVRFFESLTSLSKNLNEYLILQEER